MSDSESENRFEDLQGENQNLQSEIQRLQSELQELHHERQRQNGQEDVHDEIFGATGGMNVQHVFQQQEIQREVNEAAQIATTNLDLLASLAANTSRVETTSHENVDMQGSQLENMMRNFTQLMDKHNRDNQEKFEHVLVSGISRMAEIRYGGQAEKVFNASREDRIIERQQSLNIIQSALSDYKENTNIEIRDAGAIQEAGA